MVSWDQTTSEHRLTALGEANREDRRLVSGGMLEVHNGQDSWQKAVSLSSWESELYAAVSTGVEALGLQSGLRDFGNSTHVTIACDHAARPGLGLAKHVRTRHLWLQAARDEGQLDVVKIPTERHQADLLTKLLPFDRIQDLCTLVRVEYDQDSKTLEVQSPSTEVPQNLDEACHMARVASASMSSCRGLAT